MNKVLILSPGRQVHIIEQFEKYCEVSLGDYDLSVLALYHGRNHIQMPRYSSIEYKETLLSFIVQNGIEFVLSMSDIENVLLGKYESDMVKAGCCLIGVSYDVAFKCLDKYGFYLWLKDNNIDTPLSFVDVYELKQAIADNRIQLPILKKSRYGMASKGLEFIQIVDMLADEQKDLKASDLSYLGPVDSDNLTIYQECLQGEEYGVDIVNNLSGDFVTCCAKKKLAMRNGETDEAVIIKDDKITELAKQVSLLMHHRGNIDCDLIKTGNRYYIIDINPRFGGGYIFSTMAGLNVPQLLFDTTSRFEIKNVGKKYRRISKLVEIHE